MSHVAYDPRQPLGVNDRYDIEEPCPECGELIAVKVDEEDKRFFVNCPVCGHKMMLCSLCDTSTCNWKQGSGCHMGESQKKQRVWQLTDDDCSQYRRSLDRWSYELYQIAEIADDGTCQVFNRIVRLVWYNLNDDDFAQDYLMPYSYESVEQLKELYGDDYLGIAAECIFETELFDGDPVFTGTWEECDDYIRQMISKEV